MLFFVRSFSQPAKTDGVWSFRRMIARKSERRSTGHNSMVQLLFKAIKQEIRRHFALIDVIGDSTYTDQLGTYDYCGHEVDSCDCVVHMKRRMIVELFDFLCSVDVNLLKSRHSLWNAIVAKMEEFLLDEYLSDYMITIRSHCI